MTVEKDSHIQRLKIENAFAEKENEKLKVLFEYVGNSIDLLSRLNASVSRKNLEFDVKLILDQMQAVLDLTKIELEAGE